MPSFTGTGRGIVGNLVTTTDEAGASVRAILPSVSLADPSGLPGVKPANSSPSFSPAGLEYETVAASQPAQTLGATGATGDYLSHIEIQPGTTSPGNVIILDGATTVYTFPGGATSVSDLRPFVYVLGALSASGAWKITTGANVTVQAFGDFT